MNRLILFTISMLTLFAVGCKKNTENNSSLEYNNLNVNFGTTLADKSWNVGDEIGVFGTCTRNNAQNTSMSGNAKYAARLADGTVYFDKASDNDRIIANADDHNFKFYAYFPFSNISTDKSSIPAQVPEIQYHSIGAQGYGLYVSNKNVTSIVPTIKLDFKSVFSTVELFLPNDLLDDAGNSVVRSLTLRPTVASNFNGSLADGGTYNLENNTFTSSPSMRGNSVQLDFGASGITLTQAFTKVTLAVAPFTIPAGGMDVVVKNMQGVESVINILGKPENEGTVLAAGKVLTEYLSKYNDGIIPVTFPVIFPLGYVSGNPTNSATIQPRWIGEGIWSSPSQTQAYAQWYKISDPAPSPTHFRQFVNSTPISSPEIRGIWTGDYLEFVLPVKKFAAGTAVTIKLPMYTRQGPVFWNVEYLDGDTWKSNKTNVTSYDPAYTREATFSLIRGGKIIEHTMVFTQAVESGNIKIRLTCADGTIQADTDTKVAVRTTPWVSGSAYGAPFYFYLAGSDVTSITFSTN